MADLMEYVNVLADQIGPRPVSTEEEHQASIYIAQELSDDGLDVSVDEFATPSGVRWPYVLAFAAAALGTIISGIGIFVPGISLSMFIIGLILVVGGFFVYFTEHNNNPVLSKMRASGVSQNVVAKYVPASVAHDSRRRKKIIIAAHVDTVRAQPEASPKIIAHAPLLYKIIFYSMIGLVAVLFVRLLPLPWPEVVDTVLWVISLIASAYVLVAAACIVASRFTPYISGGNDNASSIAVLLSVAHLLVNPEERERYTRDRSFRLVGGAMGDDADEEPIDPFAPTVDDLEEPVMHSAEEAYAEGLVPEGVEVTYDDDGTRDDATVAFPALTPEEQLDVLADTAAEELHLDSMSTGAFSLDDVEFEQAGAEAVTVNPGKPGAISEMQVPDLDFTLDEEIDQAGKKPVERLDDAVIFAEYMGSDDHQDEVEPVSEDESATARETERVVEVEAQTEEPAMVVEEEETVDEEPPEPAPIYVPIETPTRSHDERPQVARPVPSWYAAAKEKAAKDLEKKAATKVGDDEPPVFSYRSRFADAPAASQGTRVQEPEEEPASEEAIEVGAEAVETVTDEVPQRQEEAPAEHEEEAAEIVDAVVASINLDIPDDQLDELSPDASGLFARVEVQEEGEPEVKSGGSRVQLTSRIPNIGSSDDKEREERKSAHESLAARGTRSELQSIPVVDTNDDIDVEQSDAEGREILEDEEVVETAAEIEPVIPATARTQRKKPTARHVTQQFVPTRATRNHDIHLGENRQEAPVSSTFEDTPQAAPQSMPSDDPFAPKSERRTSERSAAPRPRQRAEAPASTHVQPNETLASAASTSSFPSLTGSFPALSGAMPVVDAGDFSDFAETSESVIADDAALDSFMAAGQTTEINIPESRFRNAVDKVGGLFNRKGKSANDDYGASDSDAWSDEDDYGWKGGGYFEEEAESAFDAVRQRAAQIRESVVSMTENDLLDKEVWFVALGASGAGGQGMKNFLDLHSSELRGSLIINLEAVGAGTISYVDVEGTGKPHRADRRLMSLVKKASKEVRGSEMKAKSLEWRNTDATPAMIAGMRALTLMGFADNGVAPVDWHTAEDTANIVEEDKLEYMTRLLLKVIENS